MNEKNGLWNDDADPNSDNAPVIEKSLSDSDLREIMGGAAFSSGSINM